MKKTKILRTVQELRAHVGAKLRLNPNVGEEQLVHRYLEALDLTLTEYHAILDEYRLQRVRDKL
jgi:hypothetical protein